MKKLNVPRPAPLTPGGNSASRRRRKEPEAIRLHRLPERLHPQPWGPGSQDHVVGPCPTGSREAGPPTHQPLARATARAGDRAHSPRCGQPTLPQAGHGGRRSAGTPGAPRLEITNYISQTPLRPGRRLASTNQGHPCVIWREEAVSRQPLGVGHRYVRSWGAWVPLQRCRRVRLRLPGCLSAAQRPQRRRAPAPPLRCCAPQPARARP